MYNLFLVDGPFQLICALEAKYKFILSDSTNILVIRNLKKYKNKDQLKYILNLESWDEIIEIDPIFFEVSTFFRTLNLIKKLQKRNIKIANLFIAGFYYQAYHLYNNNLKVDKSYIIDDGAATLKVIEELNRGIRYRELFRSNIEYKLKSFFTKIIFLEEPKRLSYTLFTFFDIFKKLEINMIKNDFLFSKSLMNETKYDSKLAYFLGSPLVELELLSFEKYWELIKKINDLHEKKGVKMVYVCHRREVDKYYLKKTKELNIQCIRLSKPIELELLFSSKFPQTILSFYSTALFTLSKLSTSLSIYSYKFDLELVPQMKRKPIEKVYQYYGKSMGIVNI